MTLEIFEGNIKTHPINAFEGHKKERIAFFVREEKEGKLFS